MPLQRLNIFSNKQNDEHRLQSMSHNRRPGSNLSDIAGHICEYARNFNGSKFIACKLDEAPEYRRTAVFNEMLPQLKTLMMDKHANFVVQKYFMIGNVIQRQKLFSQIESDFVELSRNGRGCYVVRKAIEQATNFQLVGIMKQLTGQNVVSLAEDVNGNNIIQQMIRSTVVAEHPVQVIFYCKIKFHHRPLDWVSHEKC